MNRPPEGTENVQMRNTVLSFPDTIAAAIFCILVAEGKELVLVTSAY